MKSNQSNLRHTTPQVGSPKLFVLSITTEKFALQHLELRSHLQICKFLCQKQNSRFTRDLTALRVQFLPSLFSFHRRLLYFVKEMRFSL